MTSSDSPLVWSGAGAASGMALMMFSQPMLARHLESRRLKEARDAAPLSSAQAAPPETGADRASDGDSPQGNVRGLVDSLMSDGRYTLLLRPQIASNLDAELLAGASEQLDRQMALVPDGEVALEPTLPGIDPSAADDGAAHIGLVLQVAAAYLDRYPVTNRQFQAFVDSGGYEQIAIWDQIVWPAVLDFVDATGRPGPRYWREGRFPTGREDHPVVGVCWYEAAAFARWVGKRLPTDAEWVKAAGWPVHLGPGNCVQRRYPWGNTMDRNRVNLWGSGPGETVAVEEHAAGVSVGGVYQLIGNVWEWTADDFHLPSDAPDPRAGPQQPLAVLKTLRGGAFDTYFDHQATCQFASGDGPLARRHNVGFRCALGMCDLVTPNSESRWPLPMARAPTMATRTLAFRPGLLSTMTLTSHLAPNPSRMSKTIIPMDSYRLAEYAVPVPCYVCGEGNSFDAELCRHCFAPMALAHQAKVQHVRPQMVAVIGSSGVGKTVYLGMLLDMLSRQPQRMQVLARGAFSITLQQTVMASLARSEFPSKTPSEPDRWNWAHCQIRTPGARNPIELIVPDMAGEAVLEEVDHPHTYIGIRRFLEQCSGAMVLIDAAEMNAGAREQDYFAMKLLSYLAELEQDGKPLWPNRPLALVLSKADQCENCFDDPAEFAQRRAAGLWQHCTERFRRHKFFASGVAGACAPRWVRGVGRVITPLRIEPRGIMEPFEWLVGQIKS